MQNCATLFRFVVLEEFLNKLLSCTVVRSSDERIKTEVVYFRFYLTSRWFCEGKELENSPDIQIITSGELHSLVIAEAFEEDTGRYSCFASNVYGTDSTSAEIYVEGEAHVYLKHQIITSSELYSHACLILQVLPLQTLRLNSDLIM